MVSCIYVDNNKNSKFVLLKFNGEKERSLSFNFFPIPKTNHWIICLDKRHKKKKEEKEELLKNKKL